MIGEEFRATFLRRVEGNRHLPGRHPSTHPHRLRFLGELSSRCQKHQRQYAPVVESQIKRLVEEYLIAGAQISAERENREVDSNVEVGATMASWAICGACLDWSKTKTISDESFADLILPSILTTMNVSKAEVA